MIDDISDNDNSYVFDKGACSSTKEERVMFFVFCFSFLFSLKLNSLKRSKENKH